LRHDGDLDIAGDGCVHKGEFAPNRPMASSLLST